MSLFSALKLWSSGIAQSFFITSILMEPILQIDARLIGDKASYHFPNPQRANIAVFSPIVGSSVILMILVLEICYKGRYEPKSNATQTPHTARLADVAHKISIHLYNIA